MTKEAGQIFRDKILAERITMESVEKECRVLDSLLSVGDLSNLISNEEYLRDAREAAGKILETGYNTAKFSVLIPTGLWGLTKGLSAPDADIRILGIGRHRYFIFHSALGLVALRHFYKNWLLKETNRDLWHHRVIQKVSGAALGGYAMGVGVHLMIDVFQPKAVIFPFVGSLVNGTLVDDRLWLFGNSLWAFRIGYDVFALVLADEIEAAKQYVKSNFFITDNKMSRITREESDAFGIYSGDPSVGK